MKYRVFYSNTILDLKNRHIDELVFTSTQQLNELLKFHEEYPDIFIWYVPTFLSDEVFTIMEAVQGGIMMGSSDEINQRFVHMCHESNVKISSLDMCSTYDRLSYMISIGIDDIGITAPLTFDIMGVVNLLDQAEHRPNIYIMPDTVQQDGGWEGPETARGWYLLPNEQAVKMAETFGINTLFISQINKKTGVIADIYRTNNWGMELWPIIAGLEDSDMSEALVSPIFTERRFTCKQRCRAGKNHCDICLQQVKVPDFNAAIEKE